MAPKRRKIAASRSDKTSRTSSINKLAPDILSLIFEHVHAFTMVVLKPTPERRASPGSFYGGIQRHVFAESNNGPGHCDWFERAPSKFQKLPKSFESPEVVKINYLLHQLRRVSKNWKSVIEATPHFQSRIVFWLDEPNTSSANGLKAQLKKAGDMPLDVLVSRRKFASSKSTPSEATVKREKALCRTIMNALAPFVTQTRTFVFRVNYSSSLPLISRDFRGTADHLRRLELDCRIVVQSVEDFNMKVLEMKKKDRNSFKFPQLTQLVMAGNTFMDACLTPTWGDQLRQTRFDSVLITRLEPPEVDDIEDPRYEGFDLYQLVKVLSEVQFIRHLTLQDLAVGYEDGEAADDTHPINVDNLSLIGHDIVFATEYQCATYGSAPYCLYHLSGTDLTHDSVPRAHHLRLENIPNINTYDFTNALSRFGGDRLDLIDCKDLEDPQLEWIADNCQHLRRLYIRGCPEITVNGLKAMVERRGKLMKEKGRFDSGDEESESDDEEEKEDSGSSGDETIQEVSSGDEENIETQWDDSTSRRTSYKSFHRLQIQGHSAKLSKANLKWFKEHVKKFYWK